MNDLKPFIFLRFGTDKLENIPLLRWQTVCRTISFNLFKLKFVVLLFYFMQMQNWSIWKRKLEFFTQIESVTDFFLLIMQLFVVLFKKCKSKPTQCDWLNAFFKFQLIGLLAGLKEMTQAQQQQHQCQQQEMTEWKCHCTEFRTFDERTKTQKNEMVLTWDAYRRIHEMQNLQSQFVGNLP